MLQYLQNVEAKTAMNKIQIAINMKDTSLLRQQNTLLEGEEMITLNLELV